MISIIIPLYNKENCIRKTLYSVLSQSYRDFEIVVVNDGSKDNSVEVVNSIKDERIRLINKENEGVSRTRNRGIEEARGEWILFLDADDIMCKDCLQALTDLGNQFPETNILCGNFITKDENKCINSSGLKEDKMLSNPFELIWTNKWNIRLGSFITKKEITPYFIENMFKGEDVLYCFDLLEKGKVAHTPCDTMIYVRENSNLSLKLLPLENTLSWTITFKNKNTYLRSIYIDILVKAIIIYAIRYKKYSYSFRLLAKHISNLLLYTPKYLFRKLFNI